MPRRAIYRGDLEELKRKLEGQYVDNGQCARLVQELTDVGNTKRWMPGERVVDAKNIAPGTVIANFKIVDGKPVFPNQSSWHAGLYQRPEHGKIIQGKRAHFTMVDQFPGKTVGERPLQAYTPEEAKRLGKTPANNANEYYIVMVP